MVFKELQTHTDDRIIINNKQYQIESTKYYNIQGIHL